MFLNRGSRAVVALVAVLTLLVCEGIWAAQAPLRIAAADDAAAAPGGCHAVSDEDVPGTAAPSPCDSAQAPSDAFKLPLVALVVLPALVAPLGGDASAPHRHTPALVPLGGAPPPLRVLHCCFRN